MECAICVFVMAFAMLAIWHRFCQEVIESEKRARRRRVRSARQSYLDEQEHDILMSTIKRG